MCSDCRNWEHKLLHRSNGFLILFNSIRKLEKLMDESTTKNYIESTGKRLLHIYELFLEYDNAFKQFYDYLNQVKNDSAESRKMFEIIAHGEFYKQMTEEFSNGALHRNVLSSEIRHEIAESIFPRAEAKTVEQKEKRFEFTESLVDMEGEISPSFCLPLCNQSDYRIMHVDGDIIITDPCYIMRKDKGHENDWENCKYGQEMETFGIHTYLTRDTIFGDWSCSTINADTGKQIGSFCADAGMVSVFLLDEVLKYNPGFDYHKKREWTTTLIEDFHGTIKICVEKIENSSDNAGNDGLDEMNREVRVIGTGNVNFYTTQTAL